MKSFLILILITGFLISLHGRGEAETFSHLHASQEEIADPNDSDDTAPAGKTSPLGPHTDQHGCYHSHVTLHLPAKISPLSPIYCSTKVTTASLLSFPIIIFNITHPPQV